jgi:hypothetical protein
MAKAAGKTDGLIPEAIDRCKFSHTTIPSDPKKVSPPTFRLDPYYSHLSGLNFLSVRLIGRLALSIRLHIAIGFSIGV